MQDHNRRVLLTELSPLQQSYFEKIARISTQIEKVRMRYPELDWHDLRHIFERLELSPAQRLALGLRRRIISHGV